jgi:hypothetical protein
MGAAVVGEEPKERRKGDGVGGGAAGQALRAGGGKGLAGRCLQGEAAGRPPGGFGEDGLRGARRPRG